MAFSPVWDWRAADDVCAHLERNHIPVNPVYAQLRHLGAPDYPLRVSVVVDANSRGYGRITRLRHGWPDLFDRLVQELPRLRELTETAKPPERPDPLENRSPRPHVSDVLATANPVLLVSDKF